VVVVVVFFFFLGGGIHFVMMKKKERSELAQWRFFTGEVEHPNVVAAVVIGVFVFNLLTMPAMTPKFHGDTSGL
jgi:uncharacterized membrane protein